MGSVTHPAVSDSETLAPEDLKRCLQAISGWLYFELSQDTQAHSRPDWRDMKRVELKLSLIGVREGWL